MISWSVKVNDQKYPSEFYVDITGFCNLHCRLCPEGRKANDQPKKFMTFEEFRAISESFLSYSNNITLINWSEAFLNKELFNIIEYIKKKNKKISLTISTNGNFFKKPDALKLLNLGLDNLVISISGITNAVYTKYHAGGNLSKLLNTIKFITDAKDKYKSSKPNISLRYLLFPFNYISLKKLKRFLLKTFGENKYNQIDDINIDWGSFSGTDLNVKQLNKLYGEYLPIYKYPRYLKYSCNRIFNSPTIRADGTVFPCCAVTYNSKHTLGNLNENTFAEIWNGNAYRNLRETFNMGTNDLCNNCTLYFPDHKVRIDRYFYERVRSKLWLIRNLKFKRYMS